MKCGSNCSERWERDSSKQHNGDVIPHPSFTHSTNVYSLSTEPEAMLNTEAIDIIFLKRNTLDPQVAHSRIR